MRKKFLMNELNVLLDDSEFIVLDKPAGLPTANTTQEVESLYSQLRRRVEAAAFIGVVSRLDQPVSGVVIFAKTRTAAACLSEQFRERQVTKEYVAVVEKRFPGPLGEWTTWQDQISWDESARRAIIQLGGEGRSSPGHRETTDSRGMSAVTRARVNSRVGEVSLVELNPQTGRRHQLRAQLASHGCPIVGDRLYGGRLPFLAGQGNAIALHSSRLSFKHPLTGKRCSVSAKIPSAWKNRFPQLALG